MANELKLVSLLNSFIVLTGGPTISAGASSQSNGTIQFSNSNGVTFGLNAGTLTASVAGGNIRLDQVLDPNTDKVFAMGLNHLQFQYQGGASFSTNATRQGLFEIDVQANLQDNADVFHVHQSVANPTIDLVHLEAAGANVTLLRLNAAASVVAEVNAPIKWISGSVPMVLGTSQSNQVDNLNANFLQGRVSSYFAVSDHTHSQYLTTAAQSNHSHNFATTTTGGSNVVVGTANSAGVTIGVPAFLTTAQPVGAYLTTARASNDAIGLNTALTANGVSVTANSSGLSLNFPAFLTTAAQSNHSHGNPTLALTNLTGTTSSNSAGLTLSLSAAAPGGGVTPVASASNGSFSFTTLAFSNANNVTFGTSVGGIITASVAAPGAAAEQNAINLLGANTSGNTTATGSTIGFSGVNLTLSGTNNSQVVISAPATSSLQATGAVSIATNGNTISIGAPLGKPQYWACPDWAAGTRSLLTNATAINGIPFFMPFEVRGVLSAQELMWDMSRSTSGSNQFTVFGGIYSYSNSSVAALVTSFSNSYSNTATASVSGIRQFEANFNSFSLTPGQYLLGMMFTAANTASMNYSLMGAPGNNQPAGGVISGSDAYHTHTTHQAIPLEGRYTVATAALPGTISGSQIRAAYSGASAPIRQNWTLGTHN